MKAGNFNGDICETQSAALLQARAFSTVLKVGLIAGTLDITDALVWNLFRGIAPVTIFQHIASGLIGVRAFGMGSISVALGVMLHYAIAIIWTAVFYFLSRNVSVLLRRPVMSGLTYGVCVYILMNFVVLPVSALPPVRGPITLASRINGVLALMLCIGLTISLLVRRESERSNANAW